MTINVGTIVMGIAVAIVAAILTAASFHNMPPPARSVVCEELGPEAMRQLLQVFKP